jgi:pyrroline-5-carboxylate reductase
MTIGLIGAGNMARALALGWGAPILCTDGGSGRADALAAELGGEALAGNAELAERADLIVLCHKPAQLEAIAAEIGDRAPAVVSVLGGTTIEQLRAGYPSAQLVRAMPNTAVEVRAGMTALCPAPDADPAFETRVRELFERVGETITLPERLMDVAAAISGVGPAYTALVAEAQVDAAVKHGMPAAQANRLVVSTLAGSATLLRARDGDTLAVRREVTSPGGVTARGLAALERGGLRSAFADALEAVVGASRR